MKLLFTQHEKYCEASLSGQLDAGNVADLNKEFAENLHSTALFIFDLRKLDFIDSSGLGGIISCLKKAVEKEGDIKFVGLTAKVKMVFEVTKAYKIFDIFESVDAARASITDNGEEK